MKMNTPNTRFDTSSATSTFETPHDILSTISSKISHYNLNQAYIAGYDRNSVLIAFTQSRHNHEPSQKPIWISKDLAHSVLYDYWDRLQDAWIYIEDEVMRYLKDQKGRLPHGVHDLSFLLLGHEIMFRTLRGDRWMVLASKGNISREVMEVRDEWMMARF